MSLKSKEDAKDVFIGFAVLLAIAFGAGILSNIEKHNKAIEDAKPKKMAPCASVLDACYKDPNPGVGDAAYFIKQEDRLYGTRQHEAQVDEALGAINAQAICDHKKRQGVECE
jgi:hypothetical protein